VIPDGEDEDAAPARAEERRPDPGPLKLAKRYFHILGIDIIIDSDLKPQVLELNDRPSLAVTVDFERELKESIIAEAFEHVCPNGEVRGNSPSTSRWTQIFPLRIPGFLWKDVVDRILNPALPPIQIPKTVKIPVLIRRPFVEFPHTRKDKKKKTRKTSRYF
jgi:hypothetical protein